MRISSRSCFQWVIVAISWAFIACVSPASADYDQYESEWVRDAIRRVDRDIQADQNRLQELRIEKQEIEFELNDVKRGSSKRARVSSDETREQRQALNRIENEIRRRESSIREKQQQKVDYRKRLVAAKGDLCVECSSASQISRSFGGLAGLGMNMSLFASWGQINAMIPSYSTPYFMASSFPTIYPMQNSFFFPGVSAGFSAYPSYPSYPSMMPGMYPNMGVGLGFGMNTFMPQPYMQQPFMQQPGMMGGAGFNTFNPMYDMQRQMANQQNIMIANGQAYDAQMRANMLSQGGGFGFGMPQMGGYGAMNPGMF